MNLKSQKTFLFTLFLLPHLAHAQPDRPYKEPDGLNNWFVELGGAGLFYSINYEKVLYRSDAWGAVGRIGLGYNPADYTLLNKIYLDKNTFMSPFTASFTFGRRKEKLETGGGFTLLSHGLLKREIAYTVIIGFRVVETNKIYFRIAYTPIFLANTYTDWYGVSLGRNF